MQSQSLQRLQQKRVPGLSNESSPYSYGLQHQNKNNFSLPQLPHIKKNYNVYVRRPTKLPQIQSQFAASEQQLMRRRELDMARKSITPEKNSRVLSFRSACKTKAGCHPNKATKINQDTAIICPKQLESFGYRLYAVSDGHGVNGHIVSNHIKVSLPKHLARVLRENESIEDSLIRSFGVVNREIWASDVDTNLSGSTTVSVLIKDRKIYCANVGDSRAIMGRYENGWQVIELSRDHKPDDPSEKQHILNAGGRVEQQRGIILFQSDYHGNPIGPFRVWLSYIQAPGLAMSRSLGDKVGCQAGVTADPEIKVFDILDHDEFIIVASDGVWEYLTNQEVLSFVLAYDNPEQASERILNESIQAWRRNSLARDDITCVVIFLK